MQNKINNKRKKGEKRKCSKPLILYTHILTKKEKGITIISLVVTIIILLILAGVTISTVTGDNGLFSRAKETVEESKKAEYQEGLTTIGLGIKLEKSSTPISSKEFVDLFEEEMNRQIVRNTIFKDSKIRRKNDETLRVETKEGYVFYVREDEALYIGKAGEVDESEVPDITLGDINFKYSTEEWTNKDVTVELSIGESVENKDNYLIEYSKDARNWTRYTAPISMTANGEIYARAKDKFGDIKVEKYATGEVQNIDKNAPTPGTITMKMASSKAPYIEDTEVYQNVEITVVDGEDNESESGHKITTCTITGGRGEQNNQTGSIELKASDNKYQVTVTTEDNAGNKSTSRAYILNPTYAKETKQMQADGENYYLPEGFKLAEDSATQISEGIVVEDKNENQWVWIPCYVDGGESTSVKSAVKYDRYAFSRSDWIYSQTKQSYKHSDGSYGITREGITSYYFHEGLLNSSEEYKSIGKYNGYFIGRYESGKENEKLVIQKNKKPYVDISQGNCIKESEALTSNDGSDENKLDGRKVFTKLCSSYAWDTALKFIDETHRNYSITSKDKNGNITGNYNDHKFGNSILDTGLTIPVCNIYDMGGNVHEYTTEVFGGSDSYVIRGGSFSSILNDYPPSMRCEYGGFADGDDGFRTTLYIKY